MAKTHTYTARSGNDLEQAVTFTLYGQTLTIEPRGSGWTEQMLHSTGAKAQTAAWPLTLATVHELNEPRLDLLDVDARIEKDNLRLMAWGRSHDRRWLPIAIVIEHVDNPTAARVFVGELNRRKMSALRRAHFFAWLGARAVWLLAGSLTALVAALSLRSKRA